MGECGLDYHWPVPKDAQLALFEAEIRLALELDKPIVVHDREAHADVYALLKKYKPKGILHCYSGSAEGRRLAGRAGHPDRLRGRVHLQGGQAGRQGHRRFAPESILLETDCPYMAPSRCGAPGATAP